MATDDRSPDAAGTPVAASRQRRPSLPGRPPLALAALVATVTAATVTFLPVALVVTLLHLAEGEGLALPGPARIAAAGWLLAHGVPLQVGAGTVGLFPLALTGFAAWRVARAGVHVTRAVGARGSRSWRRAVRAAAAVAVAYGLIGLLVAAMAAGRGWWAEPLAAAATLAGFGFVAAGYGALRTAGVWEMVADRIPPAVRHGLRTGLVATLLVVAAGAVAVGVSVAWSAVAATDTLAAYGTGVAGQAGITLVCLAYAPNLAVWAVAYLLGPGFAAGAGTVISSSEVVAGPLPALPVFAGLPDGPLPEVGAALLAAVTVVSLAAGWRLGRLRVPRALSWPALLSAGLLAGPVAAVLLTAAAFAAGGPLGAGHLATLGPVAWQVGLAAAVLVTPGTLLGATLSGLTSPRR
jgi:hypothetical protein